MKNYYQILGIAKNASDSEIKRAYRTLALKAHPDKGGSSEQMALLGEAHEVLSDPQRHREYDEEFFAYNVAFPDELEQSTVVLDLLPTAGVPHSKTYRDEHRNLVVQYQKEPLSVAPVSMHFLPFNSGIYQYQGRTNKIITHDIFSFIQEKSRLLGKKPAIYQSWKNLTPEVAVQLLMDFLSGEYNMATVQSLLDKLSQSIQAFRELQVLENMLLYEAVSEILALTLINNPLEIGHQLLISLRKIADYANHHPIQSMPILALLFQNKYFRNLFLQVLHFYWLSDVAILDDPLIRYFDGRVIAQALRDNLKREFSSARIRTEEQQEAYVGYIRCIGLIAKFEKDLQRTVPEESANKAHFYREKGFLLLDWLPALRINATQSVILNTLLQIGLCFQKASLYETVPAMKMADEKTAFQFYQLAMAVSHASNPDMELYLRTHCLKYIAQFTYNDAVYVERIPQYQARCLVLADVFPFFQPPCANPDFIQKEGGIIIVMRQLLHRLMEISEYNKIATEKIALDHDYIKILYQVYEACLKNWYEETYQTETEKALRLKLMEELLRANRWTFADLQHNLSLPSLLVARDADGWMLPDQMLLPLENEASVSLNSVGGFELNLKTGQLDFFFKPWDKSSDSSYKSALSLLDIKELLTREVTQAIFSLDPVDPNLPYHPFNKMRFFPSSLHQSQLLRTMLLTDYLLKFLTTNQEVQGKAPYERRTAEDLIRSLPDYLKKIILDYHSAERGSVTGSLHRFWIEAEEVSVALDDASARDKDVVRVAIGDIKMVVRKHVMMRDAGGNLVDTDSEDEGWDFYALTSAQKEELSSGRRTIPGFAIILIQGTCTAYFVEDGHLSGSIVIKNCDHYLKKLFKSPRDANEKIKLTQPVLRIVYKVTCEVAKQTGRPHRFSPELVFAQEFTAHYDEFAQHFPEFARLRELSKATVFVRMIEHERLKNEDILKQLKDRLNDGIFWKNETKRLQIELTNELDKNFSKWRVTFSISQLRADAQESLNEIKRQLPKKLNTSSPEINQILQEHYNKEKSRITSQHGSVAWNSVSARCWSELQSQVPSLVSEINNKQYHHTVTNLTDEFKKVLKTLPRSDVQRLVESFLAGSDLPLRDSFATFKQQDILDSIWKQNFSHHLLGDVTNAFNGNLTPIVTKETNTILEKKRKILQEEIVKRELVGVEIKKQTGLTGKPAEVDLAGACLWVPASISRDAKRGHSRTVYGGVNLSPHINAAQNAAMVNSVFVGTKVYRTYGDGSGPYGQSWTTVNPGDVQNYRSAAGLPNANTGRFVVEAVVTSVAGLQPRSALPCAGHPGGLPEVIVADPKSQLRIVRVSGVNPEF